MGFEYKDIKLGGVLNPGKITAPGALSVKPDNTFRDLALKGAFDSIGGLWKNATSAEDTGFDMWGSELGAFDTAYDAEIKDSVTGLMRPKNNAELIGAIRAKEAFQKGHPNAGKAIWNRPGWTEYVPNFFMEGGSNYQVPENAIASRNVEDIRAKWKPNWSGSQETKTVEAPVKEEIDYPAFTNNDINAHNDVIDQELAAFDLANKGVRVTDEIRAQRDAILKKKQPTRSAFSSNPNAAWVTVMTPLGPKKMRKNSREYVEATGDSSFTTPYPGISLQNKIKKWYDETDFNPFD